MKITSLSYTVNNNYNVKNKKTVPVKYEANNFALSHKRDKFITFGALPNIKLKKFDIAAEKAKLLKQIDTILQSDTPETDLEDKLTDIIQKSLARARSILKRKKVLLEEIQKVSESKILTKQQKSDRARAIQKEWNLVNKIKIDKNNIVKPNQKQKDENIDFRLINRFRRAISEDNFNLHSVFNDFYKELENIQTIEELNKKYPKIKTPQNPAHIVAKKLESSLTRDFYEKFNDLYDSGQDVLLFKYVDSKLKELIKPIAQKYKLSEVSLYEKTAQSFNKRIIDRFAKAKVEVGFSFIPEQRKNKIAQITDNDIKLLYTDFDDFVISVIKKHYLNAQKLNEIQYTNANQTINISSIHEPEYKFEKLPEKIKQLMVSSDAIEKAQRDYEHFNVEQFKERLNYFANKEPGNNETIFEGIVAFDTCKFEKGDIEPLIKFLKELDDLSDGKISVEQAINNIKNQKLSPRETEKINAVEKQKAQQILKIEQKKNAELNVIKNRFDAAIDILYANNLNNIANSCLKYRPESLQQDVISEAETVMSLINQNTKELSINKAKLESGLLRWDTFNLYKKTEADNPIYLKAVKYAQLPGGKTDIDKAGQYIINAEIVENYPQSLEYVRNSDVLSKIMEKAGDDKEAAIKCLCKFDDYTELNNTDKNSLAKFQDLFDIKDTTQKYVLKHIIENLYVKNDTTLLIKSVKSDVAKGTELIKATITARAKQQILDKYKYPVCLEYMRSFEEALTNFASLQGSAGVKKIGRNNKSAQYQMELKLKDHDDRLFSIENNYYFDIFSEKGKH
ncbi:MAG TPA: hypothetical protein IAD26_08585 [Candidatus Limenecus avicola]|uniref:Uncharacterized protein n=1 Tax=Candidatus Limenecus avicola TaxID=2840847 RepID=A0A9D1N1G9_9CLOT|nr:hypothetical protein [Candidatus Limenecus avicola]